MTSPFSRPDLRSSYRYLLRWSALGGIAGIVGAVTLALFVSLIEVAQGGIHALGIPVPVGAAVAALLVGALVYRVSPDAAGEGIPSYLFALNRARARFPWLVTLMKFPAAVLTLGGFGSGGVVGPVGRVTAGLVSLLGTRHVDEALREERSHTAAICGLAATVAALLHAPIGGGIFAVEIVQRANMRYRDLFPAVLAGAVSVGFSRLVGWEPLFVVADQPGSVDLRLLPWALVLTVGIGLLASVYVRGYGLAVRLFRRDRGAVVAKVVIGMVAGSALAWAINPGLLGTAAPLFDDVVNDRFGSLYGIMDSRSPLFLVALVMLLLRLSASFLTTGSGMSAGLTAPAIQVGLLAAVAAGDLLERSTGLESNGAFLVVGMAGMLAGSMNVPIAATVLAAEIFGTGMGIPAVMASVICFQMNRHRTIYDYALAGSGRMADAGPA